MHNGGALLEFPPVIYGDHSSSSPTTGCSRRSASTPATPSGSGASARSRPPPPRSSATPSTRPCSRAPTASRRASSWRARLRHRGGALVARAAEPERVLAADRPRDGLLRLPERDRLRAQHPQRRRRSGPTTPRARSRPARRCPAGCSTSATTPATSRRSPSAPAGRCGSRAPKARCSAAARSTRPPPSSTAACSSATPTGASTPTTPPPASSTGPCRPAPTCTPRPPSPTRPASARRSTSAPTPGPSTRSTPAPGQIAWKFNTHGRISGSATIIGRIVYFSDLGEHRTYGLGISTGRVVFALPTGAFDPAISDGKNLYITGYTGLYAFAPTAESQPHPNTRASEKRAVTRSCPGRIRQSRRSTPRAPPRRGRCRR